MSDQILRMRLRTGTRTRRLALERADLVPARRTNPHSYSSLVPLGMGAPVRGAFTPLGSVWKPSEFNLSNYPTVVFADNEAQLTTALATCARGTRIVLRNSADYTYTTNGDAFVLHPKVGAGEVAIISRAMHDGTFPRAATGFNARARSADTGACARIVLTGGGASSCFIGRTVGAGGPGINADLRGYRFAGLHLTDTGSGSVFPSILALELLSNYGGGESATYTSAANQPSELVWDRCVIENTGSVIGNGSSFGVAFVGKRNAMVACSVLNMMGLGANAEPKAIAVFPGSGEHFIDNSMLEALAINIMIGGWAITREDMLPVGVVMRRCHLYKRPEWYATFRQQVKNLWEGKAVQEWLTEGCVIDGHRAYGQASAYVHISNNQDAFPNAVSPYVHYVRDQVLRYNKIRNVDGGLNLAGGGGGWIYGNTRQARYTTVEHNLLEWAETNSNALRGVTISMPEFLALRNNTLVARNPVSFALEVAGSAVCSNATIENNIIEGAWRSDVASGMANVRAAHFPGSTMNRNIVTRDDMTAVANNLKLATDAQILYVNRGTRNYRLQSGSPGRNWGTDGFDVGVDHDGLDALTAGAVSGDW
jgi:hypothetical protein